MNLSLADAAFELEKLCDAIDESGNLDEQVHALFQEHVESFEAEVDRRIKAIWYLESQRDKANAMIALWQKRLDKTVKALDGIKAHTMITLKNYNRPFRGELGEIRIKRHSVPRLVIAVQSPELETYMEAKVTLVLDRPTLKKDLLAGLTVPGALLVHTESLRIK